MVSTIISCGEILVLITTTYNCYRIHIYEPKQISVLKVMAVADILWLLILKVMSGVKAIAAGNDHSIYLTQFNQG